MEHKQKETKIYRGIQLSESIRLFMQNGKYNLQVKRSLDVLADLLEARGHEAIGDYKGNNQKMAINFKCHGVYEVTPDNYKATDGRGCAECKIIAMSEAKFRRDKVSFESLVKKRGHELLTEYINANTVVSIDFKCGCDSFEITPGDYTKRKKVNVCPMCEFPWVRKRLYRGIKVADFVPLYMKNGEFNPKVKRSLDGLANLLEAKGHESVGEYKGNKEKIAIEFKCHGVHEVTPDGYKATKGRGCPECKGISISETKIKNEKALFEALVKERGHELKSEYVNSKQNVLIDFKCGCYPYEMAPTNYTNNKRGKKCPRCEVARVGKEKSNRAKEEFFTLVKKNGHVLLSEYKGYQKKVLIDFKCEHGAHQITPGDYKSGKGCPDCGREKQLNTQRNKRREKFENFVRENGDMLVSEYKGEKEVIWIKFGVCDHEPQETTPNDYKEKRGCPICLREMQLFNKKNKPKEEFENFVSENGDTLLSEYKGPLEAVRIKFGGCEHEPREMLPSIYKGGQRCLHCKNAKSVKVNREPILVQNKAATIKEMKPYPFESEKGGIENEKFGVVYKITNIINKKVYIGVTVSKRGFLGRYSASGEGIERVLNFYTYQEKNNQYVNVHLLNAIKKYGFDAFEVEEEFDVAYSKQELQDKEVYWISFYQSNIYKYGYNRTAGADNFLSGSEHPSYNSVTFNCEICGKETEQNPSKYNRKKHHYCSSECARVGQSIHYSGENNHGYKSIEVKCDFCQSVIKRPDSLIRKRNYCDRECQRRHYKIIGKGKNNPNFGKGEKIKGNKNGRARKVICLTTGEIFDTILDGTYKYNIPKGGIVACCTGKQKSSGCLPDGTQLHWQYYDE